MTKSGTGDMALGAAETQDSSREVVFLRSQLRRSEKRLAAAETELIALRRRNLTLEAQAKNAQRQMRAMRESAAWKTGVVVANVQAGTSAGLTAVANGLRGLKRRVIG